MEIRSRAPLRIGLAGGGTDLPSYSNKFGGVVFNATIGMYAYCTIIPTDDGRIKITSYDNKNTLDVPSTPQLEITDDHTLVLHKGVYNRVVRQFNHGKPLSFVMSTSNDAPIGSGLGTSSTMVVAILEAYNRWLGLDLNDYQKAQLAYEIEREDLHLVGGKQDQYAAVFGGFNLMEFKKDGTTIVNGLRLDKSRISELECSTLLYYSGTSRKSAEVQRKLAHNIIKDQTGNTDKQVVSTMDAMKNLKESAHSLKDCLLVGNFDGYAEELRAAWEYKKKTSNIVSNKDLEKTINYALSNGAEAVKVTGAGGGGFLMLYCKPVNRQRLINAMEQLQGKLYAVKFTKDGAESWVVE